LESPGRTGLAPSRMTALLDLDGTLQGGSLVDVACMGDRRIPGHSEPGRRKVRHRCTNILLCSGFDSPGWVQPGVGHSSVRGLGGLGINNALGPSTEAYPMMHVLSRKVYLE